MSENWQTVAFHDLTVDQLYRALRLRAQVFVVEQECAYLDIDDLDPHSHHMMLWRDNTLCAYQRCLPPGVSYPQSSIGRIVVDPKLRGESLGKKLVQRGIDFNMTTWPDNDIVINAQAHLEAFYGTLGFAGEGDTHWEDGILHRHMRYTAADHRAKSQAETLPGRRSSS